MARAWAVLGVGCVHGVSICGLALSSEHLGRVSDFTQELGGSVPIGSPPQEQLGVGLGATNFQLPVHRDEGETSRIALDQRHRAQPTCKRELGQEGGD